MTSALPSPSLQRLQRVGIPLGAIALTLLFVIAGFPYDRIRDTVASKAGQALRAQIRMAEFGPTLTLLGPGLQAKGLDIAFADGQRLAFESVRIRPAWSFSWLRGHPAFHVDLAAAEGRAIGTLSTGAEPGFDGVLEHVDLAKLPLEAALSGLSLDGIADARVDLQRTAAGPRGSLDITAKGGSIALPGMPVALPFETLTAKTELTETNLAEGLSVDLQGPMLTAQITGNVGQAAVLSMAKLDLQLRMKVVDPSLRPMLAGAGLRFAQDGSAEMHLMGSAGQPLLR
jgi:type II secretion system protein N